MQRALGLVGAGGFAREVMSFVRNLENKTGLYFVETTPHQTEINGIPVISEAGFLALATEKFFSIAIADAKIRRTIAERFADKARPYSLRAPNSFIGDDNQLGEGMILCPFTSITANARIGKHFHANIYSYVGHDCVIGDYVTFAPHVHCNGNVHIGDGAYIGTGAIIRQGTAEKPLTIGEGALIGMGAVVTKSVPPGVTVIGNPARPLEK